MNLWMKSYYRARNFVHYSQDLGLRTAYQVARNNLSAAPVAAVRPPGVAAPIYYRPGTGDLTALRQLFGQRAPVEPTNRPRLIVDADPDIGLSAVGYATRYPRATVLVVGTRPEHGDLLRRNCRCAGNMTLVEIPDRQAVAADLDPGVPAGVSPGREPQNRVRALPAAEGTLFDLLTAHEGIDLLKLGLAAANRELLSPTVSDWLPRVRTLVIDVGRSAAHATRTPFRSVFETVPHRQYRVADHLVIDFA